MFVFFGGHFWFRWVHLKWLKSCAEKKVVRQENIRNILLDIRHIVGNIGYAIYCSCHPEELNWGLDSQAVMELSGYRWKTM